jgi:HSP20 family protein
MVRRETTGGFMSLVRWEPLREFEDLFRNYSPLFGRSLARAQDQRAEWAPLANISETDKEYVIKAELPEVKKEDVKITLQDGVITISGERKYSKEDKDENTLRVESFYGTFSRSFSLPENVDEINAESKDGILRVRLPKAERAKPKQIAIQVN